MPRMEVFESRMPCSTSTVPSAGCRRGSTTQTESWADGGPTETWNCWLMPQAFNCSGLALCKKSAVLPELGA